MLEPLWALRSELSALINLVETTAEQNGPAAEFRSSEQ